MHVIVSWQTTSTPVVSNNSSHLCTVVAFSFQEMGSVFLSFWMWVDPNLLRPIAYDGNDTVLGLSLRPLASPAFAILERIVCTKSLQSCPTLCAFVDGSPPGSCVHGILQARTLEWLLCPPPGELPNPGIEPGSPALQVDSYHQVTGIHSFSHSFPI